MRTVILIAALAAITVSAGAVNEATRFYNVNFTDSPPTIDGVVSPGEWSDADPASSGFVLLRTTPPGTPAAENLAFQALFDEANLYIVITTDHTDYSGAGATADDTINFSDDFEIFWCPGVDDNQAGDTEEDEYQIAVPGTSGVRAAGAAGPPFLFTRAVYDAVFGGTWDPLNVAVGVTAGGGGGVVELAIPFAEMDPAFGVPTDSGDGETDLTVGTFPNDGDQWQFNIARIVSTGPSPNLPIWNFHTGDGATAFFAERPHGTITFTGGPSLSTGFLYFAGGAVPSGSENPQDGTLTGDGGVFSVLVADVDIAAGTVGNWRYAAGDPTNPLPVANGATGATAYSWMFVENAVHAYNGNLYVGPGDWNVDGSRDTADVVAWAPISSDGTLGSWTLSDVIISDGDDQAIGATAIVENASGEAFYYVMGGTGPPGLDRVAFAPIDSVTGALGAWSTTTALPNADWFNRATVSGTTIVHGTGNINAGNDRHIHYTAQNPDGTLSTWQDGGLYNSAANNQWDYGFVTAQAGTSEFAVILGGTESGGGGAPLDNVWLTQITASAPGTWSAGTAMPAARRRMTATAVDDLIIQPAGSTTSPVSGAVDTVFLGRIDAAGNISWSTSPNPMLQPRAFGGATFWRAALPEATATRNFELYR